ncbi:uncharacterized protein LY89DRAFT_671327 [Mollisia scopiformis]|uniref:Uncharacterized protein n=1 Tax=Mollisia scopiformis TaxID=149040 RepID=A0A194X414_MOLSC|nr:uncharacterized protein LY89DRAFT_671327 [Mollisia scopiformis]KUJ14930.1 hypothetical protein LY89DRAFT_671327 [Mollisia scopiformis]
MTGQFTEKDPQRCAHYARFMSHLTLAEANSIFWLLFITVLILMCISSLQHHKSNAIAERDKALPKKVTSSTSHQLKNRRLRLHYLSIASLCLVLAATATVFECFALFNIEFCDGEDLMQIYWGFWSVLQVGSNIAILGVMVQFWIVLGDIETPSWAVALGTPVLVFAAIGFGGRHVFKETVGRIRRKRQGVGDEEMGRRSDNEEDQLRDDDVVGPRDEIVPEKYNGDRSLSTASTTIAKQQRVSLSAFDWRYQCWSAQHVLAA